MSHSADKYSVLAIEKFKVFLASVLVTEYSSVAAAGVLMMMYCCQL